VPIPVGGSWFLPNISHMIRKWTVKATLAMGYQADLSHCYRFHILKKNLQFAIFYNIILGLEKSTNSQD
jgi:hypothetical protein